MGVKGGCSPQNNLPKSEQLVIELKGCRNKNLQKLSGGPFWHENRGCRLPGMSN
jgi:hypothetical protein